jgi:Tol biopolymer transport system component
MKKILLLLLHIPATFIAQSNTEVFVFDLLKEENKYQLIHKKNTSNNPGYDSQPFFYDNDKIIFASTRNGQTDILLYNLKDNTKRFISNSSEGGEYSPQKRPNSKNISAVRLDNSGLQRFYSYNIKTGKDKELIKDFKIAYPAWYNKNTLIAVTIFNDALELFIFDLKNKINSAVAKNVGRSVHKIPNSNLVSFISKETTDNWLVKSLNPKTKEIKTITPIGKSEDITWLPNGTLLIANGKEILKFNPKKDSLPKLFFSFIDENSMNISRIAVNSDGTKIALVAEESP